MNGGKHLFKDCPKMKAKKEKEKAALAAAAALATESKGATGAGTGPTEDQLRSLLAALFTSSMPTVDLSSADGGTGE